MALIQHVSLNGPFNSQYKAHMRTHTLYVPSIYNYIDIPVIDLLSIHFFIMYVVSKAVAEHQFNKLL